MQTIQTIFYLGISFFSLVLSFRLLFYFAIECTQKKKRGGSFHYTLEPNTFFSIIIPAKEEASVIVSTLQSIWNMDYSKDWYEIVFATDQKENSSDKPTTRNVIEEWLQQQTDCTSSEIKAIRSKFCFRSHPSVRIEDIPATFNGDYPGHIGTTTVASTKGRALNYVLRYIEIKKPFHYCSFFDAETHPHPDTLKYLNQYTLKEKRMRIWQGPALQVRNFWKLSLFSKIASLSQAFSHEYTLPTILRFIPFLGGTNMHIPTNLLLQEKGFSHTNVTEDLELGIRLWDATNKLPSFLPLCCSEQTPKDYLGYYYQRKRWGAGNIEILLQKAVYRKHTKKQVSKMLWKEFLFGPLEWYLYALISMTFLHSTIQLLCCTPTLFNPFYSTVLYTGVLFFFSLFLRYKPYIENDSSTFSQIQSLFLLCVYVVVVLPFTSFLYGFPFLTGTAEALYNKWTGKKRKEYWVKTPRTPESYKST